MMKLTFAPTSPYVRKATAAAIELGIAERIERVPANPWDESDPLPETNPIGKVPALVTDEGLMLAGSVPVCEYLDSLSDRADLLPKGANRWQIVSRYALAEGALDAAVAMVIEQLRRPSDKIWDGWLSRQSDKIARSLDQLEKQAKSGDFANPPTMAELTLAICLDYIDFRLAALNWRDGRPALDAWHKEIAQRPSLAETVPVAA